jgi:inosine/xanthosine triphosphatase
MARIEESTMVIKVMIISKNPVKIEATRDSFSQFYNNIKFFELETANTNLAPQPIGEEETFKTSRRRVEYGRRIKPNFTFYVGIEGGVIINTRSNHARIVVYSSVGNNNVIETVRGCEIPLPSQWYEELVKQHHNELGDLMTNISGIPDIKQKQGAVGFLTRNVTKRYDILKQSVTMALIPFLNPSLFDVQENHIPQEMGSKKRN